jgi:hypothetical protein
MKLIKVSLLLLSLQKAYILAFSVKATVSKTRASQQSASLLATKSPFTFENPFASFMDFLQKDSSPSFPINKSSDQETVESFIESLNLRRDPADLLTFFDEDIQFVDAAFYNPIIGKEKLLRHFYLNKGSTPLSTLSSNSGINIVVDDIVASGQSTSDDNANVCVLYHLEKDGTRVNDSTAISFYSLKNI